jgi:hypothetical protein
MIKHAYFRADDKIFRKFDNYEIWPCVLLGQDDTGELIYETTDVNSLDIAIWCVYGHFQTGGLECISDHDTLVDAELFLKTLPILRLRVSYEHKF